MNLHSGTRNYTIKDVIDFRKLAWSNSKDFLYLTHVPVQFESDFVRPDYYCFGMVAQGNLEISINHKIHNLSSNSLMIYRPGQPWKVMKVSEGTTGSFVLFNKKFLDSLNENMFLLKGKSFLSDGIATVVELKAVDQLKVSRLFEEIFAIFRHLSKSNWEAVARNLTSALIYETDDILTDYIKVDQIPGDKTDELFMRFNDLLNTHYKTQRKLVYYASQLCITSNYLYSAIKKHCGKSPTHLITTKVINEAKFLIAYTLHSFSEIAYQLNFSDPFVFSKYFKKNTGYTPSNYRKYVDALSGDHGN